MSHCAVCKTRTRFGRHHCDRCWALVNGGGEQTGKRRHPVWRPSVGIVICCGLGGVVSGPLQILASVAWAGVGPPPDAASRVMGTFVWCYGLAGLIGSLALFGTPLRTKAYYVLGVLAACVAAGISGHGTGGDVRYFQEYLVAGALPAPIGISTTMACVFIGRSWQTPV